MAMTRAQMISAMTDALNEYKGDPQAGSPYALDMLLSEQADEIAADTHCLYGTVGQNLAAGQAIYATPAFSGGSPNPTILVNTAMSAYDANGKRRTIWPIAQQAMDNDFPHWRDTPAGLMVRNWVPLGLSSFAVFPVPNYNSVYVAQSASTTITASVGVGAVSIPVSGTTGFQVGQNISLDFGNANAEVVNIVSMGTNVLGVTATASSHAPGAILSTAAGGLVYEGHLLPGQSWEAPTAVCPLPDQAHPIVWRRAVLSRIAQNPTTANQTRFKYIKGVADALYETFWMACDRANLSKRRPSYLDAEGTHRNGFNDGFFIGY
jgi:hypothetical protein